MKLVEMVRRANQPGTPEDSIRLRAACTGAVLVAIAACAALGEVSRPTAWGAMALVSVGMVFSYFTRARPPWWIKVLLAVAATATLVWFFHQVATRPVSNITTVEDPLTVLFVLIQVVHSFHVPSRRDLMFSLGASAALMAVGAAQAIDLHFGFYALAWMGFSLWGLVEVWSAASGGGRVSAAGLDAALAGVTVLTAGVFLLLPAPTVAARINFLARAGGAGSISVPGALAGDSGGPAELSKPGSPSGSTRVGGYLGFAGSLDTALRGKLGHTVVIRVRAQRPSYWVGETFNGWNGQSWTDTTGPATALQGGSPFNIPTVAGYTSNGPGQSDLQTFYVASSTADLVFHAESADELWFPTSTVFYSDNGTVVSPIALGRGAIYSVESEVVAGTPDELRLGSGGQPLAPRLERLYTQLPHPYDRVQALAQSITAGATTTYDKVQALIAWMGTHTRYSTDIPALPPGADTVDEFLFGNRVGFCEQISTSLAVMLRTLEIPVREAVGYVPGPYNPITDLYDVEADDAHAWVQVWLGAYGWQSFDPTAVVPLASPAPGATALHDLGDALGQVPVVPVSSVIVIAALATAIVRWRRSRPRTWAEQVARSVERAGRRAGRPRGPSETLVEYAAALESLAPDEAPAWRGLASSVEASVYGGREPPQEAQRQMVALAQRSRIGRRRRARAGPTQSGATSNREIHSSTTR